jgi:hypothetical protein
MIAAERFWSKVEKTPGCWLWSAFKNGPGYGWFRVGQKPRQAHRVSWELHNGPIPDGLQVLHRCDVRSCVRPDHLFLGTQLDNIADMLAKGRHRAVVGSQQRGARLDETDIIDIRTLHASGVKSVALARAFSVSPKTIWAAVNRLTWRHVP